jgi:hypothetical protein
MLKSPLGVACAAYVAVEESWDNPEVERVLAAVKANLSIDDPSVMAAVAIRGAMLDTWWVRDWEKPDAWDRALSWATIATECRPDWLLGWLVLVDGHRYRGETSLALSAATQTLRIAESSRPSGEFLVAAEVLFGGRGGGWTRGEAEELVATVEGTH